MKILFRKYRLKTILIFASVLCAIIGGTIALTLSNSIYALKILANLGNSNSQDKLGNLYVKQKNTKEAAKWYLKASSNNLHAKVSTVLIAFQTNGVYPVDCAKARELGIEAANDENSLAQATIASAYRFGSCETALNHAQALYWALKVVDNSNSQKNAISLASLVLADLYSNGYGVTEDPARAHEFLLLQSKQGLYSDAAIFYLAGDYYLGRGTEIDYKKAITFYQQSAEHGNSTAQAVLSDSYAKGIGTPQNYELAYMWATIAHSSNDAKASDLAEVTMIRLTFLMSHEQIQKAQNMAASWKEQTIPPQDYSLLY